MTFAQLTHRESLCDIEVCLRAQKDKLYYRGIRGNVSRSAVADVNERRDWRIYADLAQALIRTPRPLYADEDLGLDLDNAVYALDASTIDLRLSVFPWALFRSTESAVKLQTPLNLQGNIPTFIHISDGKLHDVNVLDLLIPEPRAFIHHGSWPCGLRAPVHVARNRAFLRHPRQVQYQIQASLLSSRGQIRWCSMRSDHCAERS